MRKDKLTRIRKQRPPLDSRPYRFADEVAAMIGCSEATVNRYSNGEVPGVPRLPYLPRGRRARVWMCSTIEKWVDEVQALSAKPQ
jgi:hypothetical protein